MCSNNTKSFKMEFRKSPSLDGVLLKAASNCSCLDQSVFPQPTAWRLIRTSRALLRFQMLTTVPTTRGDSSLPWSLCGEFELDDQEVLRLNISNNLGKCPPEFLVLGQPQFSFSKKASSLLFLPFKDTWTSFWISCSPPPPFDSPLYAFNMFYCHW